MAVSNGDSTILINGNDNTHISTFDSIPSCIESFAAGNFLIVLDSPSRENEGDLIIAARHLTPSKAAFMIRYTSGYLCAPMSAARAKLLDLPPMVPMQENADPNRTAYAVTVDAVGESWEEDAGTDGANGVQVQEVDEKGDREGFYGDGVVTTGISAHDRSVTCRILADSRARHTHLRRPGHVVPLTAREGGVRARRGHTEAGWEFARLAGIVPEVAVIGEMVVDGEPITVEESGSGIRAELGGSGMMRMKECLEFGRKWGIKCCTIEDLAAYVEEKDGRFVNGEL